MNSRSKGIRGELEFLGLLNGAMGLKLERNLEQTRESGADNYQLPGIALEIKRDEKMSVKKMWAQAVRQAGDDLIPVLAYRRNRKPWTILLPSLHPYIDEGIQYYSIEGFIEFLEYHLKE